ncbi:MAG: DUF898 domain-containing protein [Natronospirillum sp.]
MTDARYDVIFEGKLVDGYELEQVKTQLTELFAIAQDKAVKLFSGHRATLKSNIDTRTAETYRQRLNAIGMHVELVVRESIDSFADLTLEPLSTDTTTDADNTQLGGTTAEDQTSHAERVSPTAKSATDTQTRVSPFRFHGNGREYFGIWIVNILLSIITLGVYSAWAKVRNKQYFYGNTEIEGSTFEYTADPVRILIGRLIAVGFFVLYVMAENSSLVWALIAWGVFMVFMPWAIRQSLRFNARNSRYRNVPFAFTGTVGGAFAAFIAWPLLGMLTAGLLLPLAIFKQQKYILSNHQFGTSPFHFHATAGDYYRMAGVLLGIFVAGVVVMGILMAMAHGVTMVLAVLVWLLLYMSLFALFSVRMANLKFTYATLGLHGFDPAWEFNSYLKLIVVNTLLTLVTLGIYIPWAKVRTAQYAAEHTNAVVEGDLDAFVAAEESNVSALGEGIGDIFDLDVGA